MNSVRQVNSTNELEQSTGNSHRPVIDTKRQRASRIPVSGRFINTHRDINMKVPKDIINDYNQWKRKVESDLQISHTVSR